MGEIAHMVTFSDRVCPRSKLDAVMGLTLALGQIEPESKPPLSPHRANREM
jgi:hypothetical protein